METLGKSKLLRRVAPALALLMSVGLAACGGSDDNDDNDTPAPNLRSFLVSLNTDQEIPAPTGSSATGTAGLVLDLDSREITGSISTSNLSGGITAAHIHDGFAGATGNPIVTLNVTSASAAAIPDGTVLSQENFDKLLAGGLYLNVHTLGNAPGEVRGQILPNGFRVERTSLSEDEAWVAGSKADRSSSGMDGEGYLTIDTASGAVTAVLRITGTAPAAAHVHRADTAGDNGGIVVEVTDADSDGVWMGSGTVSLTEYQAGALYFNVHETFPGDAGSIRGQIGSSSTEIEVVELTAEQAFIADTRNDTTTTAEAVGVLIIDTTDGTTHARLRGANTTFNVAHVHNASTPGGSGGTPVDLVDTGANGIWTSDNSITNTLVVDEYLDGKLYFNAHNQAAGFAGGELRGQIPSPDTEVIQVTPNPQEAQTAGSNASGTSTGIAAAMLIVNKASQQANAALRVEQTATAITGVHVHNDAVAGDPIMIPMSDPAGGSQVFSGELVLSADQFDAFENGDLYFNIHTSTNLGGELRGQILR